MKKNLRSLKGTLLSALLIFIFTNGALASHIAGAEITYKHISGNTYEVNLNLYVDCYGFDPGATQTISLESSCAPSSSMTVNVLNPEGTEVSQICPGQMANTVCNGGTLPGMWIFKYSGTVTLPFPCDTWKIFWSVCCRNNATVNLVNPGSVGTYVEATLNSVTDQSSTSAYFNSLRIPYVCQGQLVNYSCWPVETEGDSLNFSLVNALDIGASPLTYAAGYSATSPVAGITINSSTGLLVFTPSTIGTFVVVIKVEEFDSNGDLKGSVMRDIQFNVSSCVNSVPSSAGGVISNFSGTAVLSGSNSIFACPGSNFSFDLNFTDADAADVLSFQSNIDSILPGAIVSASGSNPLIVNVSWLASGTNGTRLFSVDVKDGACPAIGFQSFNYSVEVLSGTTASSDAVICLGQSVPLVATGGTSFTWSVISGPPMILGSNFSCNNCPNPIASPSATTVYEVQSNLSSSCDNIDTITVTVVPDFSFSVSQSATSICMEQSIQLSANPISSGAYTYAWAPSLYMDSSTIANPLATIDSAGTYIFIVDVTSAAGCVKSDTLTAFVQPAVRTITSNDTITCGSQGIQLSVTGGSSFNWSVISGPPIISGTNFSCTTCASPVASPTATTTYVVTSDLTGSCINTDTIVVNVVSSFTYNATIDNASPCISQPRQLNISGLSPAGPGYTYSWSPSVFLDISTIANPVALINSPGTYYYISTVTSSSGCSILDTVEVSVSNSYAPSPSIIASDSNVCSGTVIQLNAVSTGVVPSSCGISNIGCASSASYTIGSGTSSNTNTTYPSPYGNWYSSVRQQYLYTAAELTAAGVTPGKFDQLDFNISTISGISTYNYFSIGMACTNLNSFTSAFETGLLNVFPSTTYNITTGWNAHPFTNSFVWDGISNVIVEVCMNQLNPGPSYSNNSISQNDATSYVSCIYSLSDAEEQCPALSPWVQTVMSRPRIRLHHCTVAVDSSNYIYSWSPGGSVSGPSSQITNALVSGPTNYAVTVTDTITGCSSTVFQPVTLDGVNMAINGSVDYAGSPVSGYAKLFSYVTGVQMPMADSVAITAGNYIFSNVAPGDYIIQATPDTLLFPLAFPTYYDSQVSWDSATIVSTVFCNDTIAADISLLSHPVLTGTNVLAGVLIEGTGYMHAAGMPLEDINVMLLDNVSGVAMDHEISNSGGIYYFRNVPDGCYKLYVDIPGLPMDSTYHICVSGNDTLTDLNFIADANSIFITEEALSLNEGGSLEEIRIYPNPATDVLKISNPSGSVLMYTFYDITGKKIIDEKRSASNDIEINTSAIDKGVYILRVNKGDQIRNYRVIKQ